MRWRSEVVDRHIVPVELGGEPVHLVLLLVNVADGEHGQICGPDVRWDHGPECLEDDGQGCQGATLDQGLDSATPEIRAVRQDQVHDIDLVPVEPAECAGGKVQAGRDAEDRRERNVGAGGPGPLAPRKELHSRII